MQETEEKIVIAQSVLLRAICNAVVVVSVFVHLSACTSHLPMQVTNWLAARKTESLEGWETVTVGGKPLMESLGPRVALVIVNLDSVSVELDDSGLSIQGKGKGTGTVGSAVPVTGDGYFLTAAHNLDDAEKLHLVVGLSETEGRARVDGVPARIVWKSRVASWKDDDWSPGEPMPVMDFAIIHSDAGQLPPLAPFALAGETPQVGEAVIIAGWPFVHLEDFKNGARLAAGKIVSVHKQDARGSSPAFVAVRHDTPFVIGDSGGPLLDRQGNLIGINCTLNFTASRWQNFAIRLGHRPSALEDLNYFATSTMPHPNWLWEVIRNDRLQRQTDAATSERQGR